jgi:hypothetical protein
VACRNRRQRQLVKYVEQVRCRLGCAAFSSQLVEDTGPQRDDPRDRMTVLGYLDDLAGYDPFQHPAGLLSQLSYAYSVTHSVYTVAQSLLATLGRLRVASLRRLRTSASCSPAGSRCGGLGVTG